MTNDEVIQSVAAEVRRRFEHEATGHDWWHIERVRRMAIKIGTEEHADLFIVELAALLHDIADWKFHGGDDTVGGKEARKILTAHGVKEPAIDHICDIIDHVSYKGAGVETKQKTIEGKVVQDADRLDAIGAIGIARAFAFGGKIERPLYDPDNKPVFHKTKEAYHTNRATGTTMNHFYEKLLLLKDCMNTVTARKITQDRHEFMEEYLERFYKEWAGEL